MPRKTLEGRREYNKSKSGRQKVWVKESRKRHPEKYKNTKRDSYERTKDKSRIRSKDRRQVKLEALAGRKRSLTCELCYKPCDTVWDHCHNCGKFRGWLCRHCNRTLGFIEKHLALVVRMLRYSYKHREECE